MYSASRQHWNRIPDSVRELVVDVALEQPELTPRELAWHLTDTHEYFVSESSVYRILKAPDDHDGGQRCHGYTEGCS
jgi:hypothetical protein